MAGKKGIAALVPMKGHSERVSSKNIRDFSGRPLLFWVLKALHGLNGLSAIYVDTDSALVKDTVRQHFGSSVKFIDRPHGICGDTVPMNRIIAHDISLIDADIFIQTHATNPLVRTATFNKAVDAYFKAVERSYDSLFSVRRHQSRFYDSEIRPINHDPANLIRTQDLRPIYEENSNFYIFSRDSFSRTSSRIGPKPYLYEVPRLESIDIDDEEDFKLAEYLFGFQGYGEAHE
ncbi:MAG: acylneuraminate cytidylyltransferase family protein [Deltaproteobacteria bacterium]|nr:acylneuraminate cytidylyltransferase family protein [Deltaproteobacteria bacterium]